MRQCTLALIEDALRQITQAVTSSGDNGVVRVERYLSQVFEIDNDIAVLAAQSVCSIRVPTRTCSDFEVIRSGAPNDVGDILCRLAMM